MIAPIRARSPKSPPPSACSDFPRGLGSRCLVAAALSRASSLAFYRPDVRRGRRAGSPGVCPADVVALGYEIEFSSDTEPPAERTTDGDVLASTQDEIPPGVAVDLIRLRARGGFAVSPSRLSPTLRDLGDALSPAKANLLDGNT